MIKTDCRLFTLYRCGHYLKGRSLTINVCVYIVSRYNIFTQCCHRYRLRSYALFFIICEVNIVTAKKWIKNKIRKRKKDCGSYIIALSFGLKIVVEKILLRHLDFEHFIYTCDLTTTTPYKILLYVSYIFYSRPVILVREQ